MSSKHDVIIVGAGPAGSFTALHLLEQGVENVLVVDKSTFPRDKLCGEFLSGESREMLGRIGALAELDAVCPAPIGQACFTTSSGQVVRFALPSRGVGVSRRVLDQVLLARAGKLGADVFQGVNAAAGGITSSFDILNDFADALAAGTVTADTLTDIDTAMDKILAAPVKAIQSKRRLP